MTRKVKWGDLGYITYKRTYARRKKDGTSEEFDETVERELRGIDKQLKLTLTEDEKEFYRDMRFNMKGSVAGRFMWQLGTKTVDRLGLPSLQNCAFTVIDEPIRPFTWAMDLLCLGSGVGFSIKKEHVYQLPKVKRGKIHIVRQDDASADFIVPDTREGWVKLLGKVLKAYFYSGVGFTYSVQLIRGKGSPIKGFGGVASGAEILVDGIDSIIGVLNSRRGTKLRPIDCLDIMNIIGSIVVAGNVRRSAQLAIGDFDDIEYLRAKRWDLGAIPNWRAMSNNSVDCPDTNLLTQDFWDTYKQGEPYGLVNMELSRKIGRLGDTRYQDPDAQGYNPCFSPNTLITTKNGLERIDSLVGKDVEIFSQNGWVTINNFRVTGENQKVLVITMYDGSKLRVTPYHSMILEDGSRIEARELLIGDKLMESLVHSHGNISEKGAYIKGFLCGDGTLSKGNKPLLYLYPPKYVCEERLISSAIELPIGDDYSGRAISTLDFVEQESKGKGRKSMRGLTVRRNELSSWCKQNKLRLPNEVFKWDEGSKCEFLAGLFDSDGTASDTLNGFMYQLSSSEHDFLLDVQTLLKTIGVKSKVSLMRKAATKSFNDGYGEYKTRNCYRLTISQEASIVLSYKVKFSRLISFENKTTSYNLRSKSNTIVSIEDGGIEEKVYCCTVPETHSLTIGIGLMVGQCAEQPLADKETCCLAEIYLSNIESLEEMKKVATMLYKVNKHSLALSCHLKDTEDIVHKNMRMGIGITGYAMSSEEQRSWLSPTYEYLRELDKKYSAENGFNESIKLTTVKPSGTLSLLAGTTSGVHPATAGCYFIRRISVASNSELIEVCRRHGYHIEYKKNFDGTDDRSTFIVEFPCSYPEGTPSGKDVDVLDQLKDVQFMQKNWSDNSVSVTAYYKLEDLDRIKKFLDENWKDGFKSLSFLLYSGHGFVQAPFEEISKELYLELKSKTTPITSVSINEDDVSGVDECAGGACPIK